MTAPRDVEAVLEEFFARQRAMYSGGDLAAVEEMLAVDIVWHVPGRSPIAGDYRGREGVIDYFARRRELAGGTLRITRHPPMCNADTLVQFADGEATIADRQVSWQTVGVYRVADGQIVEAWLVPLDLDRFDAVWSAGSPT
jgi:uncharacterized protein